MLNKIMLIGNLGADPELRYTPSGDPFANFSIAVTQRYTDNSSGELVDNTEWFDVSVWGSQAESVNQYLARGSKVYVEGRFKSREYVGADGQTRKAYGIRAFTVLFLDKKQDNDQNRGGVLPKKPLPKKPQSPQSVPSKDDTRMNRGNLVPKGVPQRRTESWFEIQ